MNTYIPDKDINEWVSENSETIFSDILNSVQCVIDGTATYPAIVCKVRTDIGVLDFLVKEEGVLDSLKKAELWFAENELYMKAAKARDLQKIVKK